MLQSPTISYQFDIWQNGDICNVRCTLPHSLHPLQTEFYHTMSLLYVAECRCIHMRPFCHSKHINWLKCFHVTSGNNYSSDSVLSWGVIRNYLMHHFYLLSTKNTCIHLLLSTLHACDELQYSMTCPWWIFSVAIATTSLYICITTHVMHFIHCDGHNELYRAEYKSYHFCVIGM